MGDNRRIFSDNEKMVLFNEVDGRCPICGKPLTNTKNGQIIKMFEVAHIYPANPRPEEVELLKDEERLSKDVNSLANVIAVCRICHKKFDTPRTIEEYRSWPRAIFFYSSWCIKFFMTYSTDRYDISQTINVFTQTFLVF